MFKNLLCMLIALIVSAAAYSAAFAAGRVALVIGNGRYLHLPQLAKTVNDAGDMTKVLEALGFEVVSGFDLAKTDMDAKIREFQEKASDAELALFFYDGHGLQMRDKNYFLPVDADIKSSADVVPASVSADQVLQDMSSPARPSIVLIDASRFVPIASSLRQKCSRCLFTARGLAEIATRGNMIIVFAAGPDELTEDRDGRNSAFTAALLRRLPEKQMDIGHVATRVKRDVYEATQGSQRPWANSNLVSEVYLHGYGKGNGRLSSEWLVVIGSFPEAEFQKSLDRLEQARAAGFTVELAGNGDVASIAKGFLAVVIQAATREEARTIEAKARQSFAGAHVIKAF